MIRQLLIATLALSMTACVNSPVKDDSPASDLDALKSSMARQARPVLLPNNKTYCVEDATTEGERDACALDLEDALFRSNMRAVDMYWLAARAIERWRLSRNPCGFWERLRRADRCDLDKNSAIR